MSRIKMPTCLATGLVGLALAVQSASAQSILVEAGEPRAIIVVPSGASSADLNAAEELQLHLVKASGAELNIVDEAELESEAHEMARIYIGLTEAAGQIGINQGDLGRDEFFLHTAGGNLFIVGETGSASRYGVSEFLQRELGVRWLWPGELGTYVPKTETVITGPLDARIAPGLKFRRIRWRRLRYPYQYDRDPFNVERNLGIGYSSMEAAMKYAGELARFRNRHRQGTTEAKPVIGHRFSSWWREYGQDHPEWFRLDEDGRRGNPEDPTAVHIAMCVANPELHRYLVEEAWDGRQAVISLGEVDRRNFCQCPDCLAWDGPQPAEPPEFAASIYQPQVVSDRHARFWKAVYELAVKRNPEVTVSTFLYWNYMPAPLEVTDLGPGIYGEFVPWAAGRVTYYPMTEEADTWLRRQWLGWAETGIRMAYRPNYLGDGYAMPKFNTWQTGEFFRFAYEHGMEGVDFDSLTGQWAVHGPSLYLHFRLIADPTLTVAEVREEYFSAFGPAAEQVEQYFDYWENYAYSIKDEYPGSFSSYSLIAHKAYPPAVFEPAREKLAIALETALTAPDKQYSERVRFLELGLQHAMMCARIAGYFDGDRTIPADQPELIRAARETFRELTEFRHQHEGTFFADLDVLAREERLRLGIETLMTEPGDLGLILPWELWDFRIDPEDQGENLGWHRGEKTPDPEQWIQIPVPAWWRETEVGRYYGYGWYQTSFHLPTELDNQDLRIHFEGVDEQGWVYVNGVLVGEQSVESTGLQPGSLWDQPFQVDIPAEQLRAGEDNLLVVRVHASGGQAGIYQPVWIGKP